MKRFQVTVNGIAYDVTVEEIGSEATVPAAPAAARAPKAPAAPAAPAAKVSAPAGNGVPVKAPMPGTIQKINVKPGTAVKRGDVLCVLEAMKMENDICAPQDGTVQTVTVAQGSSVATDEVLLTLN